MKNRDKMKNRREQVAQAANIIRDLKLIWDEHEGDFRELAMSDPSGEHIYVVGIGHNLGALKLVIEEMEKP